LSENLYKPKILILHYTISKAEKSDASAILALQKLAFRSEAELHNNLEIPPMVQTLDSIQQDFSTHAFYKLIIDGKIIGALKVHLIQDNTLWIGRLVVHPQYQNRGLGKAFMQYIEGEYNDVSGFELFTAEKSLRNIRFYEGLGYTIHDTFTEPGHSDIILVKMVKRNFQKNGEPV
jgi:N-acetylglutamate synthase-like GNAT family acetyltransferase